MKKIILSLMVLSFSLSTTALAKQGIRSPASARSTDSRTASDRLPASVSITRAEAEQYSKILARMGNYALYCDMAKANNDHAFSNAYAEKHQVWRDLDRKAWVSFGGENEFDSNNTKEFNKASLAFIHLRDGERAPAGGRAPYAGLGTQAACSQGLAEFNQLVGMDTRELVDHVREVIAAPAGDAVPAEAAPAAAEVGGDAE